MDLSLKKKVSMPPLHLNRSSASSSNSFGAAPLSPGPPSSPSSLSSPLPPHVPPVVLSQNSFLASHPQPRSALETRPRDKLETVVCRIRKGKNTSPRGLVYDFHLASSSTTSTLISNRYPPAISEGDSTILSASHGLLSKTNISSASSLPQPSCPLISSQSFHTSFTSAASLDLVPLSVSPHSPSFCHDNSKFDNSPSSPFHLKEKPPRTFPLSPSCLPLSPETNSQTPLSSPSYALSISKSSTDFSSLFIPFDVSSTTLLQPSPLRCESSDSSDEKTIILPSSLPCNSIVPSPPPSTLAASTVASSFSPPSLSATLSSPRPTSSIHHASPQIAPSLYPSLSSPRSSMMASSASSQGHLSNAILTVRSSLRSFTSPTPRDNKPASSFTPLHSPSSPFLASRSVPLSPLATSALELKLDQGYLFFFDEKFVHVFSGFNREFSSDF